MRLSLMLTAILLALSNCLSAQGIRVKKILRIAEAQTGLLVNHTNSQLQSGSDLIMPRTIENGEIKFARTSDWTSGFFPGVLWQLYYATGNTKWEQEADRFTRLLDVEKLNGRTHDMGFKMSNSFGNGYFINRNKKYEEVILQSAKTLSGRFNKKIGSIRSWDHSRDKWDFPVIIDNMMNLELLFLATRISGDSSYHKIAVQHALTTNKNHFRSDNSSYHVVDYDSATGSVLKKNTHQGFSDESAWARGQAWGLYGFTTCYLATANPGFLQRAEKIANFILHHPRLPTDGVPYWDFDDPAIPNAPRDASAAAVTASALLQLSTVSNNGVYYRKKARKIIGSLSKKYMSPIGQNKGFILMHSTGHAPAKSEVDVPINYADYYFLESVILYKELKKGRKILYKNWW